MEQLSKGAEETYQKCKITMLNSSIESILKLSDVDGSIYVYCMRGNVPCFSSFPWEAGKFIRCDPNQTVFSRAV